MKCKICGKRANSLAAMNKHYKKAHPGHNAKARAATKARATGSESVDKPERSKGGKVALNYCPLCGTRMG